MEVLGEVDRSAASCLVALESLTQQKEKKARLNSKREKHPYSTYHEALQSLERHQKFQLQICQQDLLCSHLSVYDKIQKNLEKIYNPTGNAALDIMY